MGDSKKAQQVPGKGLSFRLSHGKTDPGQDKKGQAIEEEDKIHLGFKKTRHILSGLPTGNSESSPDGTNPSG